MEGKNQQKTKLLSNSRRESIQGCKNGNKNHIYVKFVRMYIKK